MIGQVIHLNQQVYTIIGVMPQGFLYPITQSYDSAGAAAKRASAANMASAVRAGKTEPGTTAEKANAEMDTIARRMGEAYPTTNRGWGYR